MRSNAVSSFRRQLTVEPGSKLKLSNIDPGYGQDEGRRTADIHKEQPTGNCSAMVVLEGKPRNKWVSATAVW
jgi:hypothetical protein